MLNSTFFISIDPQLHIIPTNPIPTPRMEILNPKDQGEVASSTIKNQKQDQVDLILETNHPQTKNLEVSTFPTKNLQLLVAVVDSILAVVVEIEDQNQVLSNLFILVVCIY